LDLLHFREAIKDLNILAKGNHKHTVKNAATFHAMAEKQANAAAKKMIAKGIAVPKSYEATKLGLSDYFRGGSKDPSKPLKA
jgi:hypothetical protein